MKIMEKIGRLRNGEIVYADGIGGIGIEKDHRYLVEMSEREINEFNRRPERWNFCKIGAEETTCL